MIDWIVEHLSQIFSFLGGVAIASILDIPKMAINKGLIEPLVAPRSERFFRRHLPEIAAATIDVLDGLFPKLIEEKTPEELREIIFDAGDRQARADPKLKRSLSDRELQELLAEVERLYSPIANAAKVGRQSSEERSDRL